MIQQMTWSEQGRESLDLQWSIENGEIKVHQLKVKGCLAFLKLSGLMRAKLLGPVEKIEAPKGFEHEFLIWREVIKKIKGEWVEPVEHSELCHCRKVTTLRVDRSIVYGAHTVEEIRLRTSANTGCGTCLPDVNALLKRRLI